MPVGPISRSILNPILEEARKQDKKDIASGYWIECPSCAKQVVKKELLKKGCYVCGWKGTEENLKLVKIKKKQEKSYYTYCPKCGKKVVTEEFEEKGCFICGYKSETDDREQNTEDKGFKR